MTPERWKQIDQLLDSALQREASQRPAFLEKACAGDEELRREVESLLAHKDQAESFIEVPALEAAAKWVAEGRPRNQPQSLVGRQIGSYQILSLLGAGGMGEVYRAHDAKLERDVAVKVLPASFVNDPERSDRFKREARLLAALNHPHIGAIYGCEEADGVPALVLELVEGPTLADRVAGGAIPVNEALLLARQIAEALETAHEKGIIHRDLKPANIKITPDGVVKVLDFGLAKAFAADGSGPDPPQLPTVSRGGTREGMILGTAAYMSPEQARGQALDKRTDIWAFGCVLYQMLTGRAPFDGDTASDVIAAILGSELDWRVLPVATPANIRRLLQHCLEKDPKRRLRDIGDARIELDDTLSKRPTSEPISKTDPYLAPKRWWVVTLASFAALAIAVGIVTIVLTVRERVVVSPPTGATSRTIATQLTNYGGTEASGAVSPDGRSFVFVSDHGGTPDIWLRQVAGGEPIRLTNDTAEEADLAYAPDGENIYFTRTDARGLAICRVGVLGGQSRKVLEGAQKPAPSPDSRSLAYAVADPDRRGWALAVSALDGSSVRTLVRQITTGSGAPRPAWSRDGKSLSYSASEQFGPITVFVVDAATGRQRQVAQLPPGNSATGGQPAWLPDNRHLVVSYMPLARHGAPADLGILDVHDGSISRLTTTVGDALTAPSVSADGSRLIVTSFRYVNEVWKVPLGPDPDANGRAAVRLVESSIAPLWTFVSRDGRTLLFNSPASGSRNLWAMPVDRGAPPRQITAVPGDAIAHSSLSPDGTHVAFASLASGHSDIWTQHVDGSDLRQLTDDELADSWPVWSPDGQWIMYRSFRDGGRQETWRVRLAGGRPEKLLDGGSRGDWIRQPGRNGTWIVRGGVELIDVERRAVVWEKRLPGAGASLPVFSPDGRSISAPFRETRDHAVIRVFDSATGESRIAVRLPFHVVFRASWVDDGRALVVNRSDPISHIVLFDRFWVNELAQRP